MPCRIRSLLFLVLLVGCTSDPAEPAPTAPDAIVEETITASRIETTWIAEGDHLVSTRLHASATRVGVLLTLRSEGETIPVLQARGIDASGWAGPWVALETTWTEGDQAVARAELGFVAQAAELRVARASLPSIAGLTWSALVPARPLVPDTDVARATLPLREELATAGVRSREDWGARATLCTATDATKYRMAIHHTASPSTGDPAMRMRGIQAFHMDTRGWCDIGYHFVISIDGTVWEGRSVELLGAHVGGHNTGNIGISFLGCFHTSSCNDWAPFEPPDVMVDTAGELVRVLAGLYDVTVDDTTILGHRDHPDQATACPGDNLHARLSRIRELGSTPPGPRLAAELVAQSFPSEGWVLRPGEERAGYFELRNVGTATWEPDLTFLATTQPRDGESRLAGPDWLTASQVATVGAPVPPGGRVRFAFTVRAPDMAGMYSQSFNLVQDESWFSDPDQGGPPEDRLTVRVEVMDELPMPSDPDAGVMERDDAGLSRPMAASGCGCRAVKSDSRGGLALLTVLALVALRRRRR